MILGIVHFRIDTVLLSILKPLADVGVYSVAYRFIEQVLYIPSFFVAASFPSSPRTTRPATRSSSSRSTSRSHSSSSSGSR